VGWQDAPVITSSSGWQSAPVVSALPAMDAPDPTGSFGENLAAGAGKAVVDIGRGAGQMARSVLPKRFSDLLGLPTQADIDEAAKRDAALMSTGGGNIGNLAGNIAMFAPTAMIPGANTVTGMATVGSLMGALRPVTTEETQANQSVLSPRVASSAIGALTGGATKVLGGLGAEAFARRATSRVAESANLEAQNAVRDAALRAGRNAGYVVPPSTINPTIGRQAVESIAGKISTEQAASNINQKVTDTLGREALSLQPNAPLTEKILEGIRKTAGQAYEVIKAIPGRINADPEFRQATAAIGSDFAQAAKDFPASTKNAAIEALNADLAGASFSPRGIIEKVKQLRFEAGSNFKAFDDPGKLALARAQRQAAEALDNLVERNLTGSGQKALSDAYQQARVTIAKAHDVESALGADGHINAQVLAKIGDSKMLSGPLGTIADFAGSFPKAVRLPSKIGSPETTTLRSAIGIATGTIMGGPAGGLAGATIGAVGPATVRQMMLSRPGQSLMATPSYATGAGAQRIADLLRLRALPTAGTAAVLNQ